MQRLRRLSGRRAARSEEGAFVIDGPVLVADALRSGLVIEELFLAPGADPALGDRAGRSGAAVRQVTDAVLRSAVDAVSPQPVAAIARRPEVTRAEALAAAAAGPFTLVLVDLADPGNAGTLLRAAEASGAAAVLFCGASVDPCNPKCVRASAGALFHLPVADGGDARTVLEDLGTAGVQTVATSVRSGIAYDRVDLTVPTALLLGSEAHGLADELAEGAAVRCTIPMAGRSESLNVAMAGSVIAFEALRQRRSVER